MRLQAMSAVDDDATLTQLATAWTGLALGGAKVQEAAYVYQELGDKYTWTVRAPVYDSRVQSRSASLQWVRTLQPYRSQVHERQRRMYALNLQAGRRSGASLDLQ